MSKGRENFYLTQRTDKKTHKKVLTDTQKLRVYLNLKSRIKKKSNDDYFYSGREPIGLRLERIGSNLDRQVTYIVGYDSFNIITDEKDREIGFECIVYTNPGKQKRLFVNKLKFKMYTESKTYYTKK